MDVIHLVEIGNGDHLKVVPLPRSVSLKDPQERAATSNQVSRVAQYCIGSRC